MALPHTRDIPSFISAVKQSSEEFQALLPRLQLLSSRDVIDIFRAMNNGLHHLLGVLQTDADDDRSSIGSRFVKGYSVALREFMGQSEALVKQMKTDLDILDTPPGKTAGGPA